MALSRRTVRVCLLVGLVLGVGIVAAAHWTNPVETSGQPYVGASPSGPHLTLPPDATDFNASAAFVSDTRLRIETHGGGNATAISNGNTTAQVDNLDGAWTNLSDIHLNGNELYLDPDDKSAINVSGTPDTLDWHETIAVDDGQVDFNYSGSSGTTTLTVRGLPAGQLVAAVNRSDGEPLAFDEVDANGRATFQLPNSEHAVLLQTSDGDPILTNGRPEGDQSSAPTRLYVDVDDPDYPNENVSVEFFLDGSSVGTNATNESGTVSVAIAAPSGGTHTVRAEATDRWGQKTNLTWTFGVPADLTIRNVSDPTDIIDNQEVTVTFYEPDGSITQRTTTTGTVSLDGLDPSGNIVAVIEAPGDPTGGPAYHTRQYLIQDISVSRSAYLLPVNATELFNVFELEDNTGDFDPTESKLIIERALPVSGNVQWVRVAGGHFGAVNEFSIYLERNVTYRLLVENEEDDQRKVGEYVARDEINPKTITLSSIIADQPRADERWASAYINDSDPDDDQATLYYAYNDSTGNTTDVSGIIHERNNESNVLTTFDFDSVGSSVVFTTTLQGDELNKTWMVDWEARNASGTLIEDGEIPVGQTGGIPISMDPAWLYRIALVAIPVVGALSSERIATMGAMATVAFAGLLMIAGIAPIPFVLWLAAAVIAVGGHALYLRNQGVQYG